VRNRFQVEPTAPSKCAGDNLILEKDVSLLLCRRGVVHQGNACFFSTVLLTAPPRPVKATASAVLALPLATRAQP
jgi:hypothetical protein